MMKLRKKTNELAGLELKDDRRGFIEGAAAGLLGVARISLPAASPAEGAREPRTTEAAAAAPESFHLQEATLRVHHDGGQAGIGAQLRTQWIS